LKKAGRLEEGGRLETRKGGNLEELGSVTDVGKGGMSEDELG
jgi:hypothetical protein